MRNSQTKIKKGKFIAVWLASFCALFTLASVFGLVPEGEREIAATDIFDEALAEGDVEEINPEAPLRIKAESVGLNTTILNPDSTDVNTLNSELTKGAVRYPGSGFAGENANMFVFGHSSHLPVVNNPAYKSFNNIEKLQRGDEIVVETENFVFVYKVTSVEHVSASEALVEFETGKAMLTLSTCDNFGARSERYVVEAELVDESIK